MPATIPVAVSASPGAMLRKRNEVTPVLVAHGKMKERILHRLEIRACRAASRVAVPCPSTNCSGVDNPCERSGATRSADVGRGLGWGQEVASSHASCYKKRPLPANHVHLRGAGMAQRCDVCGKGPSVGHRISHAHNVTKRRWLANLVSTARPCGRHSQAAQGVYAVSQGRQGHEGRLARQMARTTVASFPTRRRSKPGEGCMHPPPGRSTHQYDVDMSPGGRPPPPTARPNYFFFFFLAAFFFAIRPSPPFFSPAARPEPKRGLWPPTLPRRRPGGSTTPESHHVACEPRQYPMASRRRYAACSLPRRS